MTAAIGQLLPLAIGVAISPLPIVAAIMMLLAAEAHRTSTGFLVGWVVGIAVVTTIFAVISAAAGLELSSGPSTAGAWADVGLGVLLLLAAAHRWRTRPRAGEPAMPKWMSGIDSLTLLGAAGLGFALSAINPKNLLMSIGAGAVVGDAGLSLGGAAVSIFVFVVVAASSVAVPVVAYAIAADRMRRPLDQLKGWLQRHNAAIIAVLLVVIGAMLVVEGASALVT